MEKQKTKQKNWEWEEKIQEKVFSSWETGWKS
jgi:hypothetical protein